MQFQLFILSALITWSHGRDHFKECQFEVNTNKTNTPLLIHNYTAYLELATAQKGKVKLIVGDEITLACPGPRNYLTTTNSNYTVATCVNGGKLKISRRKVSSSDLQCSKSVRANVRNTSTRCANSKGNIKEIGYEIARNHWVALIQICYDEDSGVTFYTQHNLHGEEIQYAPKNVNRPDFGTEGLGARIAASVAYTKSYQKSRFNSILGSAKLSSRYINNRTSYLVRGHLSPSADFLLAASKRASFYYINTTPQWKVINSGNWKSVEARVRKAAKLSSTTYTIITGTYRVLALPDKNNHTKPISLLTEDRLPVPLIVWKIVYDPKTNLGIAILVVNNPFLDVVPDDYVICYNICWMWGTVNWSNSSKGFTYCCDLRKFLKIVDTAPYLPVSGVLPAPYNL